MFEILRKKIKVSIIYNNWLVFVMIIDIEI